MSHKAHWHKNNGQKNLFIWDLNGTLEIGSELADAGAMNTFFSELGVERRVTPQEMIEAPSAWTDRIKKFAPAVRILDEYIDRLVKLRECRSIEYATEFPTAKEALETVKQHGDDNIVVSLLGAKCLDETLLKIGIKGHVDAAYSARDDFFGKQPKGSYMSFLKMIAEYKAHLITNHASNHCYVRKIMAGDNPEDIEAGKLVGAMTFQVGGRQDGNAGFYVDKPLDVVCTTYALIR